MDINEYIKGDLVLEAYVKTTGEIINQLRDELEGYKAAHQTAVDAQMAAMNKTIYAQHMLDDCLAKLEKDAA